MIKLDVHQLIHDFRQLGERYAHTPDVRLALDLDDVSMRLMSAAGHLLQNPALSGKLHDYRKAVRYQQHEVSSALFQEIEGHLKQLGTPSD